jgi:hypothetical protein
MLQKRDPRWHGFDNAGDYEYGAPDPWLDRGTWTSIYYVIELQSRKKLPQKLVMATYLLFIIWDSMQSRQVDTMLTFFQERGKHFMMIGKRN